MGPWYRVFARGDALPAPEAVLAHLAGLGITATGTFDGGAGDWLQAELVLGDGGPVHVERFLAGEEGIRAELNAWAAFLEACDYSPNAGPLMERTIQSRQLFTIRRPADHADEVRLERACVGLCRLLASAADGFYQADGEGFFDADGALLVQEH